MSSVTLRGRGRPRLFSAAKEAIIARRHRNGMTTAELAEHYDTSRSTILAIVARNPAPTAEYQMVECVVEQPDVDPLPQSYCAGDEDATYADSVN